MCTTAAIENSSSSNSSTDDSNSNENYVPIGFNPTKFRQQRMEARKRSSNILEEREKLVMQKKALPEELEYQNLLKRGIHILQKFKKTSDLKLSVDVKREPANKTSINLREIATVLNREEDHLLKYMLKELVTAGNVTSEGRLYVKGSFLSATVKEVIRNYIEAYVVCKGCESVQNTVFKKENKLSFVKCRACGSSRYVSNIK
ncbi:translation initiation factor eIF-2 beta subunit [Binucleata daphniae]